MEKSTDNNSDTLIFLFGVWDVWDGSCSGCEMFGMWNVWDVGCSRCVMFKMWDVSDVGLLGCKMFRIRHVPDMGCGMLNIGDLGCWFTKQLQWKLLLSLYINIPYT